MVAYVKVGITLVYRLVKRICLLETDLKGRGIDRMAERVKSRDGEAAREAVGELDNHRIKAGVDVREREEDTIESIVTDHDGSRTGRIRRTTRNPIGARALHLVPISARFTDDDGIAWVKCVARNKTIQIDGAGQLAAAAALVSDRQEPVSNGLELGLE